MIRLYDTLAGEVRPLETREPGRVTLYACGPTVYDHPHLGHARSALTYDVLRRYLQWRGLDVRHVANVTDIDDKIIERARTEGRAEQDLAAEWEAVYIDAMASLGMLAPQDRPRATEWVDEMVALVEAIMAEGGAYATPTGVYLRVSKVTGYGDLVHRSLDDLRASAGARVEVDEAKEDPLDFALWKAAKPGEPSWPSPWGPGRPGWHIECAAMSLGILGDGFDLHGGGADLVFPHHTNERAEALAAGRTFARHWMHNAMLNVDGQKMAKSQGNYRTVAELLDEHPLNGRAFRLLVLQTHYRKTMEVNAALLASARAAAGRLDALARRVAAPEPGTASAHPAVPLDRAARPAPAQDEFHWAGEPDEAATEAFRAAMDDDLGTPGAMAVIFDTLRRANAALDEDSPDGRMLAATVADLSGALGVTMEAGDQKAERGADQGAERGADQGAELGADQGAELGADQASGNDSLVAELVARRQAAREARDWATADALRAELSSLDVIVEDTPAGPVWRRA